MPLILADVPDQAILLDRLTPWTGDELDAVLAERPDVAGFVRYVDNLTVDEGNAIHERGKGLMTVGIAHNDSMAAPSAELGARDGVHHLQRLTALRAVVLLGTTHFCDVEGSKLANGDVRAYVNTWGRKLYMPPEGTGFFGPALPIESLGLYRGFGIPLSSAQLFHELVVRRYWLSNIILGEVDERGHNMVQFSWNKRIAGIEVDENKHVVDKLGASCQWTIAG